MIVPFLKNAKWKNEKMEIWKGTHDMNRTLEEWKNDKVRLGPGVQCIG